MVSLVTQTVRNLPAVRETWVQSLGWEDPLVKGMATHFSTLAWRIPWTEEPDGLQRAGQTERPTYTTHRLCYPSPLIFPEDGAVEAWGSSGIPAEDCTK